MKPEQAELLFINELVKNSIENNKISSKDIDFVDRLTGDASTRKYYRVNDNKKNSYVVCLDNPTLDKYPFLEVQQFLEGKNIRVPKIYDYDLAKGYLLEEDLGDCTLLKRLAEVNEQKDEIQFYKESIDIILSLHKIDKKELSHIDLFFDYEKLMDEINFSIKFFITEFLNIKETQVSSSLAQEFVDICKRLSNEKMVFTHRDFHSRNLMVKNDELILIDFQDARLGIPQYDLVSLLEDCYYDLCPKTREELIDYYWENLDKNIHGQNSREYFDQLYSDMAIQRVFKAIGSFSYIYKVREDHRYLKYIGFAMEKLRLIMSKDKRYNSLKNKLFSIYYAS
jgi:aminoglycoside/choline kinase family phosphotransferase